MKSIKSGFTLLEVLLALTLLGIILVVMTPFLFQGLNGILKSGEKSIDIFESQSLLEEKIIDPNISPLPLNNTSFTFSNNNNNITINIQNINYYSQDNLTYISTSD